jgi:uncharacterized protein YtpQ (UPF0354 family)
MTLRRQINGLVLVSLLLAGCAKQPLSADAFTKEYASKLQAASPKLKVVIKPDKEILVSDEGGHEWTAFLDNAYKEYQTNSTDKEAILQRYIAATLELGRKNEVIDKASITPLIKDLSWLAEIAESLKSRTAKPVEIVHEALNPELIILYAEDSPKNLKYLTPDDLKATKLDKSELRALAVENLKRLLTDIKIENIGDGVYMITAGGTYEASLLLFDDLWTNEKMKVSGDYIVAIPSRDVLIVTGSQNIEGIGKIRALAKSLHKESSYSLTPELFVRRSGKFERLGE